jgi:hypothetical protein
MYAKHLLPQPRCTFIGEDEDTRAIIRCGMWFGHSGTHTGRHIVMEQMAQAIAATMGYDQPHRKHAFTDYMVISATTEWYNRLVVE